VERLDLLKDPHYLCANAAITAEAALAMILEGLKCEITQAHILILGWGRIGKCLTHQLHHLNANVTVYARREEDRALLRALGYRYATREELRRSLGRYHCIVNTVPAAILTEAEAQAIRPGCLKLELASGVWLPGVDVTVAHGLPGKCKSEASGALIAKTIAKYLGGTL
jgi:dipicolinate synthase subunit A